LLNGSKTEKENKMQTFSSSIAFMSMIVFGIQGAAYACYCILQNIEYIGTKPSLLYYICIILGGPVVWLAWILKEIMRLRIYKL
jgi:hypothetical protein